MQLERAGFTKVYHINEYRLLNEDYLGTGLKLSGCEKMCLGLVIF